jgi:hypothetical protein
LRFVIINFVLLSSSSLLVSISLFFCSSSSQYILSCCWIWMREDLLGCVRALRTHASANMPRDCCIPPAGLSRATRPPRLSSPSRSWRSAVSPRG